MDGYDDSAMIALLPVTDDWCKIELPHLTLVYAGEIKTLSPSLFNEMAKDAASIAMMSASLYLRVTGVEVFGDEEKVDVFKLQPSPELLAMRRTVEKYNASEHPFRPHTTIGPAGSFVQNTPNRIVFDRISVCWGSDMLTFWLKR